ncbi:helix-turn-helix transcriptional regulator [Alicyclobacillus dauci]|uniref:Helix-turn-helix domain-containing protein n=1 Tax=Alicyclobacillus dauci TaxID=1475485 RepID=A0ABY6YZF9_9BACL|nr:helix-turn-helix transcriptional regulator [Alicyclobacillus dauci]WAH35972.1 helix-turn-helix domain-containing protein [Alicyclobacillus dauci]
MDTDRGKVLKAFRLWVGKTQLEIALIMNVDQSAISRIESGERQIDDEIENQYVEACGGKTKLEELFSELQRQKTSIGFIETKACHNSRRNL